MPGVCRCDLTNACAQLHYLCTRGYRAHRTPGIPCALFGAELIATLRAQRVARVIRMSKGRHCERSEAIHSFFARRDGLLRCARNDADGARHALSCHHPRKRMIQYSEAAAMESRNHSVLDTPHARGTTAWCKARAAARLPTPAIPHPRRSPPRRCRSPCVPASPPAPRCSRRRTAPA
jgi:hypothetical protein